MLKAIYLQGMQPKLRSPVSARRVGKTGEREGATAPSRAKLRHPLSFVPAFHQKSYLFIVCALLSVCTRRHLQASRKYRTHPCARVPCCSFEAPLAQSARDLKRTAALSISVLSRSQQKRRTNHKLQTQSPRAPASRLIVHIYLN